MAVEYSSRSIYLFHVFLADGVIPLSFYSGFLDEPRWAMPETV